MEREHHIHFFLTVLSILICCVFGVSAEDNVTAVQKLANANNIFATKIHRDLARNSLANLFFSPTSLFFALGMLYKGAKGQTAEELRNLLGYKEAGLSDEEVDATFSLLLKELFASTDNYTLKTANAILVDERAILVPQYKQYMEESYHAKVRSVNFHIEANQVIKEINDWINDQTNGKIPDFLDHLDVSTVMTILNAIYFKGSWSVPFKTRDTKRERFYSYGRNDFAKSVKMMHKSHRMLYASSPDWEMVELPYKGERISMVIILPKERNGLAAVEDSLTPDLIREYRNKMRLPTVNFTLPKFKIDSPKDMTDTIKSLGAEKMFGFTADFSGISRNAQVRVSQVMHKAVVEVNEEGTVAAAATGVHLVPLSLSVPREIKVDHPFYFAIVDRKTSLILFSGRVIVL